MDAYYGSADAAREAAATWLFAEGSSKSPARVYDPLLGYHYRAKGLDGRIMRFFFDVSADASKRRARR